MQDVQRISIFSAKLTLWLIRQWWRGKRLSGRPPHVFWQAFAHLQGEDNGLRFDVWLELISGCSKRSLIILCPCRDERSEDEESLLAALRAWQSDDECAARHLLHPIVDMASQSNVLLWAGRECAACLLLSDINLALHPTYAPHASGAAVTRPLSSP